MRERDVEQDPDWTDDIALGDIVLPRGSAMVRMRLHQYDGRTHLPGWLGFETVHPVRLNHPDAVAPIFLGGWGLRWGRATVSRIGSGTHDPDTAVARIVSIWRAMSGHRVGTPGSRHRRWEWGGNAPPAVAVSDAAPQPSPRAGGVCPGPRSI